MPAKDKPYSVHAAWTDSTAHISPTRECRGNTLEGETSTQEVCQLAAHGLLFL